jgi:pimeloyl-ACP methyl ester carboxylesterase
VASLIPMLMQIFFTQESRDANTADVQHVRSVFEACSGEAYGLACEALATVDAREEAKQIVAKTLILLGSNEGQPFKDAAKWMNENIRDSRVVEVPVAGHASIRERPAFVMEQLRGFLG